MTLHQPFPAEGCGCDRRDLVKGLIPLDDALALCDELAAPVAETERLPLATAAGRVLARRVTATASVPPFDNAAMDGYALRISDLEGHGPWNLRIVGRVLAGEAPTTDLTPGTAMRIFTGAPLPAGADAVVMQEEVELEGDALRLKLAVELGDNLRTCGSDIGEGATVLPAGRRLTARDIAVAAAAGAEALEARRALRVALLVTGDEILGAGPAAIHDVNGPMLSALIEAPGRRLIAVERVGDEPDAIAARLQHWSTRADLVVTSGGVSVGDADHLHAALARAGGEVRFAGVAIKPGKPVAAGRLGTALWLGLPGNPGAAFVTWTLFGERLSRALAGDTAAPRRHLVVAGAEFRHKHGRCELRLARLTGWDGSGRAVVEAGGTTNSARVLPLADADGLMLIPADVERIRTGDLVEFHPFCQE